MLLQNNHDIYSIAHSANASTTVRLYTPSLQTANDRQ